MNINVPFLIEQWAQIRADLLRDFPELDEEALTDSIDGEAGALDAVASLIRHAREDEAMGDALGTMIDDMRARKERLADRAASRRRYATSLMKAVGVRKIERPDFSASLRQSPPRVEIPDDQAVPDAFRVMTWRVDKASIREALSNGLNVNWARLSPGAETISLRVK